MLKHLWREVSSDGKQSGNLNHLVPSEANAKREQMFEERAALRKMVQANVFRLCSLVLEAAEIL